MSEITVLIAGATGLVGRAIVDLLRDDNSVSRIDIIGRRDIPELNGYSKIKQHIVDLLNPSTYEEFLTSENIICALGTTIKTAGSQDKFRDVDYKMPLLLGQLAAVKGSRNFILISAIGSDPNSKIFYNRVKGEIERDLSKLKFKSLHIFHPSLLIGDREEKRTGEKLAQIFMPLFNFGIPHKYRSVHAETLAAKAAEIIKGNYEGIHIYEGKSLYPAQTASQK